MTALDLIKAKLARRETLYLVIHDAEAKRIMAAWLVYGHSCPELVVGDDEDPGKLAVRLWGESAEIDYGRLGDIANVPATRAEKVFGRLAAAGLVFPDGTISEQSGKLLRSESIAYVENLLPKGARAPYEPPRPVPPGPSVPQPSESGIHPGRSAKPGANPPRRRKAGRDHPKAR